MHTVQIAPMMGYTHRHYRYLMRRLCPDVLLYSEMVTTGALLHGDPARHLALDMSETPVVLQLGGHSPSALAECAVLGQQYGYAQINLNVGCPSSRVREGGIGASLFKTPHVVADCVAAMVDAVDIPVTVKCRIGVDDHDSMAHLLDFSRRVADAGASSLIVHARKAWLNGLNPKQNRTIPPLRYDLVARLAEQITIPVVLNGGIRSHEAISQHLTCFSGVMIGRWACDDPIGFAKRYVDHPQRLSLQQTLADYFSYMDSAVDSGQQLSFLIQPLQGLFHGQPGAKKWRKRLNEMARVLASRCSQPSTLYQETVQDMWIG
ncbi:MAG: tRNA dihydrouridine(20/20a) synthase DusA [Legionellales bacterium]|nr:tRNA dihydrouridine(20/20a) synthase DusA [Legionellales bacterium]